MHVPRQHAFEQGERGPQATGGHPHVVQLLDVLSESRPGLMGQHRSQLAAEDGVSDVPDRGVGRQRRRTEEGCPGHLQPGGQEADLEFRQNGRLQTALPSELVDEGREHVHPSGDCLHLDPAHPHRVLVVTDDDDGVVEVQFAEKLLFGAQEEGPAACPDLEKVVQGRPTGECAEAATDGTLRAQGVEPGGGKRLGLLDATAKPRLGRGRVLQGDLSLVAMVPDPQDEARSADPPVLGVEVDVDGALDGEVLDGDGHRRSGRGARHDLREGAQPPLDGPKVERVELPLDLDVCWVRPLFGHLMRLLGIGGVVLCRQCPNSPWHPLKLARHGGSVVAMARTATPKLRRVGTSQAVVRAAGGIVLRDFAGGRREVAVVHRPGRDDWSLPKGKLSADETFEECALREVQEETGLRCRLSRFVGYTEYRDRRDRPKVVAYWLMDVLDGEFSPSDEVDEMRWLELTIAGRALTYGRDRDMIASLDDASLAQSG